MVQWIQRQPAGTLVCIIAQPVCYKTMCQFMKGNTEKCRNDAKQNAQQIAEIKAIPDRPQRIDFGSPPIKQLLRKGHYLNYNTKSRSGIQETNRNKYHPPAMQVDDEKAV